MLMPHDDPLLKEFIGYFKAEEPALRERADAWATAIGLQKVDGLTPSPFLLETAKDHIEGKITQNQARRRIREYYVAQKETNIFNADVEEADKVSERIAAIINDGGFEFTSEYFVALHGKLFKGVLSTAGKIRAVNIRKHEWVLRGDSVTYGSADTIKQSLIRDFIDEREFDYGAVSPRKAISHFARFIAQIWQVHPFGEGNTRTTAVFAIKYLASLGYRVSNNMFKDNSWFFRNALVRANYADYMNGVKRDWSYLEDFFKNLLLGENNRMKSRYLLVGLSDEDKRKIEELTEKKKERKVVRKKLSEKGCQKTSNKIVALLKKNAKITQNEIAKTLGISRQAVQKHLANLKIAGRLQRIGPDKGGHWEVC
jgi:fido (protein-threonine AMPylation protein)